MTETYSRCAFYYLFRRNHSRWFYDFSLYFYFTSLANLYGHDSYYSKISNTGFNNNICLMWFSLIPFQVLEVFLPADKLTNEPKGFAFVSFDDTNVPDRLVAQGKIEINGKEVIIIHFIKFQQFDVFICFIVWHWRFSTILWYAYMIHSIVGYILGVGRCNVHFNPHNVSNCRALRGWIIFCSRRWLIFFTRIAELFIYISSQIR